MYFEKNDRNFGRFLNMIDYILFSLFFIEKILKIFQKKLNFFSGCLKNTFNN